MSKLLRISSRMAIAMGIFLPVAETVRRMEQIMDPSQFLMWFDDYILGVLLIVAALRVFRQRRSARGLLIAAWGIATGGLLLSTLGQLQYVINGETDPGIFPVWLVLVVKVLILLYMLSGLHLAIRGSFREEH